MLQFKISKEEDNNKVSIKKDIDYPVFSFKHITTNKKYNINYFNKARDKAKWYVPSLLDKPVRRVFLCDIVMN